MVNGSGAAIRDLSQTVVLQVGRLYQLAADISR